MSGFKCSIPFCPQLGVTQLRGAPHGIQSKDLPTRFTDWFCADHAAEYESLGYEPVSPRALLREEER